LQSVPLIDFSFTVLDGNLILSDRIYRMDRMEPWFCLWFVPLVDLPPLSLSRCLEILDLPSLKLRQGRQDEQDEQD
jgi:hypothetical protein